MDDVCPSCEGFTAKQLRTVLPEAFTTLGANSLWILSVEHLVPSEPHENHLFLLPFRYSECKLELKLSPFTLCNILIEKTEKF